MTSIDAHVESMAIAGHGHAHRPTLRVNSVGLWLFFLSETFLFAALLAGRFYLAGTDKPAELDQELGLGITAILLISSLTAFTAEVAMSKGQRGLASMMLVSTIVLGLVFFGGVVFEWSEAHFHQGEPYGTSFFTMTGLHASHVVSGVGILALLLIKVMRGQFSPTSYWGIEAGIKYWHFVDVVWVFYYPSLYLIN